MTKDDLAKVMYEAFVNSRKLEHPFGEWTPWDELKDGPIGLAWQASAKACVEFLFDQTVVSISDC